jgi:hypothetical protein
VRDIVERGGDFGDLGGEGVNAGVEIAVAPFDQSVGVESQYRPGRYVDLFFGQGVRAGAPGEGRPRRSRRSGRGGQAYSGFPGLLPAGGHGGDGQDRDITGIGA